MYTPNNSWNYVICHAYCWFLQFIGTLFSSDPVVQSTDPCSINLSANNFFEEEEEELLLEQGHFIFGLRDGNKD